MPSVRRWQVRTAAVAAAALATGWVGVLAATPAHADLAWNAEQWVLRDLGLYTAWGQTQGKGVTVAVIDSGVNGSVSDLDGQGHVLTGPDDSGVDTSPQNPNWGVHGTWMASLIAGHGHGFDAGILGAAPESTVLSIRVITDQGDPNYAAYEAESAAKGQAELAEAITYAVSHGAGVISMSLGYSMPSPQVRTALQDAYDHNVVVVASAGNSGDAAGATGTGHANYSFPADYPGVLGVAAVNANGQVASFSSENLSVQVAAPGDRVPAQGNDGQYWYVSGTSPACALTAGVVALIKSAYPKLTDAQVISAITSSTTHRPSSGWDEQIGFGEVNAPAALAAAHTIATAAGPAAGLAATTHFGGGPAAVPAAPVSPRGPGALIGFGLLAIACLGLLAFAASKLFGLGGSAQPANGGLGGTRPAGTAGPAASAAPAAPAGPAPYPPGQRPWHGPTRPLRSPEADRPDGQARPAGYGSSDGPRTGPAGTRHSAWQRGSPPPRPRHAAPRTRGNDQPERP